MTENSKTKTIEERYEEIRKHGYYIDVRDLRPVLVKGQRGDSFASYEHALEYAENEISQTQKHNDSV